MESVKEGSSSADYSHYTDQALDQLEGQLERRKNCIESPLSSWTVLHRTDSWGETLVKVALAVITLTASLWVPSCIEFFFHKLDENDQKELDGINSDLAFIRGCMTRRQCIIGEGNPSKPVQAAQVSESPKVKHATPVDMEAAQAKKIKKQIEKEALKQISSREFKKQIMTVVKDDLSASMITSYILSASSIDNAMDTVEAARLLNPSQLKEVKKILNEATSQTIFFELTFEYGVDEAQKIFARDYQAA